MSATKKKKAMSIFTVLICAFLIFYCVSLIMPAAWGLLTSLKDHLEYRTNMFGLPKEWHFDNYAVVLENFYIKIATDPEITGYNFRQVYILEMSYNSVIYSIGLAFLSTLTAACMAYITARFKYRISKFIYTLVIITMILPIMGSLPSELKVARMFGLYDTMLGMMIMKTYFFGMYFLVFYSSFGNIPQDYYDAAQIDGASNFTIMFGIMFPFVKSLFFSVFLLRFIGFWNDYQTPMMFIPSRPTLAYGLFHFANECYINEITKVPMQLAACFMMAFPILVVFFILQKRLMGNISMGGLKG